MLSFCAQEPLLPSTLREDAFLGSLQDTSKNPASGRGFKGTAS